MDDDAKQFIENLEARFGGPVGYRTFSTWFASNEGIIREFGVFIFEVNGIFHFEDFERKPSLLGFSLKPSKKQAPYVKFERSFDPKTIEKIEIITKSDAQAVARGAKDSEATSPANMFQKIFSQLVTKVVISGGPTYFFELINPKEFVQAIKEETDGRIQSV
jgi:hypothetical protein